MGIKIYGDVLAAVNFTVTLLILRLTGRLLGVVPGKVARYVSSLLGAAAAFILFVPIRSVWLQLLYRLLISIFLVGVGFPQLKGKLLLRAVGLFYLVSFLTAGVVAGLLWLFPSAGFYTMNGVVYFNIHPLLLIGCVAAAYLVTELFDRFNARRTPPTELFALTLRRLGRTESIEALADSGNRLTEPFSGLPVVVVTLRAVWRLLKPEERALILEPDPASGLAGVRWVLLRTVGEECLLPAFKPDALSVLWEGRETPTEAYFAVTPRELEEQGRFSAVFNPKMIQVLLR